MAAHPTPQTTNGPKGHGDNPKSQHHQQFPSVVPPSKGRKDKKP